MLLKLWGVKIRVRTPAKGIMSAQHEKVWLFDHNLLFLGSANATENSLNNCEETNVAITDHKCIEQWAEHFLKLWNTAQDPDWTDIESKEELALEAVRKRPARDRSLPCMN
jgi:phosphatidylserine/phosphatidylglycerophosphate/cardiolipin synthase-like enzyme